MLVTLCGVRGGAGRISRMPKKPNEIHPANFLREWRRHRKLSQEKLAEEAGLTHGFLSQVENRKTGLSQSSLTALADALGCLPGDLLLGPPSEREKKDLAAQLIEGLQVFPLLSEERRKRILGMIEDAARAEGILKSTPDQQPKDD